MKISSFHFAPPWWAAAAATIGAATLAALGFWQLDRAHQKERLQRALLQAATKPAVPLAAPLPEAGAEPFHARVTGRYLAGRQLLLDNQVRGGLPGYDVWTPLRLAGGALVVVDRGWLPMNPDRRQLPDPKAPAGDVTVSGSWRPLPRPGLRLGSSGCDSSGTGRTKFPAVVEYPTRDELICRLGQPVAAGVLLLDPAVSGGFVREWRETGFPPSRHYGYAVQWFALSLTVLVLFVVLNLKRAR